MRSAPSYLTRRSYEGGAAIGVIVGLLVLWVVLAVVGFLVKSLFWLAIAGIVLFVATGIFGAVTERTRGPTCHHRVRRRAQRRIAGWPEKCQWRPRG